MEYSRYKLFLTILRHARQVLAGKLRYGLDCEIIASEIAHKVAEELGLQSKQGQTPIASITELDRTTANILTRNGFQTLEEVMELSYEDLLEISGIGSTRAKAVVEVIEKYRNKMSSSAEH